MALETNDESDSDSRTIFVGGLAEKMTEAILYELFFQAGPIERVSIPKDGNGRFKSFGFITYKHLMSVEYALNIFAGTSLFGRELLLKYRNANKNRDQQQQQQHPSMSLRQGFNNASLPLMNDLTNPLLAQQQAMIQQQLVMMATGQNMQNFMTAGAQMLSTASSGNTFEPFASTRSDLSGSQREHFVDRNRYHRDEGRSNRSNPYRRSRSRSPSSSHRTRSPPARRSRFNDNNRNEDRSSNYHRWGKR